MKKTYEMCMKISHILQNHGDIYIRCAGQLGQQLCFELQELGISVTAFLDSDVETDIGDLEVPIYPPEYIYQKLRGHFFVLIAIGDDLIYEQIVEDLIAHGLEKGIDFGDFSFLDNRRMADFMDIRPQFDFRKKFETIAIERMNDMKMLDTEFHTELPDTYNLIPNLDVPLTTYCSLKCAFCSHCIPYANPPRHFEAEKIVDALDRLLSVAFVACIGIMGGEPFVYPQITEFIERYSKMHNRSKIGFTRIVTNGTVLPPKDFFAAYSKLENAYIYVSNYGKKSGKIKELVSTCREYGIKTYVCPYSDEWMVLGDVMPRRNYNEKELRHLYAVCGSHSCVQLLNGRVYACGRTPLLNEDGLIPFCETDYCKVAEGDITTLSERLHEYLYEKPYLEGCRYCDGQHVYSKRIRRGE